MPEPSTSETLNGPWYVLHDMYTSLVEIGGLGNLVSPKSKFHSGSERSTVCTTPVKRFEIIIFDEIIGVLIVDKNNVGLVATRCF